MEAQQNMHDTREGGVPAGNDAQGHQIQTEPPIQLDLDRKLGRGPVIGLGAALIVLAIFIFIGIRSRASAEQTLVRTTDDAAIRDVAVIKPIQGSKALEVVLPANTQAYIDTPIYARTNGYLRRWYADIGAHVHQGQLLAEIETPELDQQVQQAQSDVATATSNLHIAEITAERWKKLLAKDAVSKQESDQANSDLTARTSAVASAQANVRRLQQMQSFERIVAPFDGTITARNVDVGALIQGGDSGTPKAELFHMAATGKLRLFVPVPEVYAASVRNGEQVEVTSDASPDLKITGTVVRTSDSIDISSRTLNVEVDVENSDHKLLAGQYAFVHLPIPPSSASLTVPAGDILFRGEGLRIGVVRNGHVELVPVKIGHDYGATVEIVSGLNPQDLVIQNPSDSLAQGERVRIEGGAAHE